MIYSVNELKRKKEKQGERYGDKGKAFVCFNLRSFFDTNIHLVTLINSTEIFLDNFLF